MEGAQYSGGGGYRAVQWRVLVQWRVILQYGGGLSAVLLLFSSDVKIKHDFKESVLELY